MRLLVAAVFISLLGGEAYACRLTVARSNAGAAVPATMSVASGKSCEIRYHPLDGMTVAVARHPSNGTVSINKHGYIRYQPRGGFVGEDRFDYVRSGYDDFRTRVVRRLAVRVTVTR